MQVYAKNCIGNSYLDLEQHYYNIHTAHILSRYGSGGMEPHEQDTEIFLKNKIAIIIIPSKTGIICWARAIYLTLWTLQHPTPHDTSTTTFCGETREVFLIKKMIKNHFCPKLGLSYFNKLGLII